MPLRASQRRSRTITALWVVLPSCFCFFTVIEAWTSSQQQQHQSFRKHVVSRRLHRVSELGSSSTFRNHQRRNNNVALAMSVVDDQQHEEPLNSSSNNKSPQRKNQKKKKYYRNGESQPQQQLRNNANTKNITATVEKKIRVAKAQAEIDRILNGPDAPFDAESELKKVVSIAPPVVETLPEKEVEREVSQLEQDLYQAVKQQDYAKAATVKREISQMHIDDCAAVLQVNGAFYRAFSEKNYDTMESIWLQDGTSTCIHPSSKSLVGSKAVLNSWKRMFESPDGSFQRNWMEPVDIRLSVKGASTAIVTCDEHVYARRFVRGQKRQTELINKLTATNIFRKVAGQWKICHHHASWHADSDAAKRALRGAGGGATTSSSSSSSSPTSRMLLRQQQRLGDEDDDDGIAMDGILGMSNFGPLLGSDSASGDEKNKPVKRIVMATGLQDLLNGNLGDLLSGADSVSSQDDNGAVIHFGSSDAELVDDGDDDDDDVDVHHHGLGGDDDETPTVSVSVIKQWGEEDDHSSAAGVVGASGEASSASASSGATGGAASDSSAPKDALRQDCISALRKLAVQGSISPKQKRILLTDIITCSAKGEFSMVEVAYELLCGEGDDKDAAEEEFADQCRVFSQSLPETPPSPPQ